MLLRLLPLLSTLLASDLEGALARKKRNAVLYGLAFVAALSAWLCLVWAACVALVPAFGPALAPVVVAAGAAAAAAVIALVVALLNARDRRRASIAATATPTVLTAVALAALPSAARSRPALGLLTVAALGYAAWRLAGKVDSSQEN